MTTAGLDVDFDPIQAARDNRERLRQVLMRLQQIGLAWALESHYPNPADWESRIDRYLEDLSPIIDATAFTHNWTEQDARPLIKRLPVEASSVRFWSVATAAADCNDLIVRFGLSNDALGSANAKLEEMREHARRRNRVVEVCGREFDSSDENLSGLWSHICSALPHEDLRELAPIDLKKLTRAIVKSGVWLA